MSADKAAAKLAYLKSAQMGHPPSQFRLGNLLRAEAPDTALKWVECAASQDHAVGQYIASIMYAAGEGAPIDSLISRDWLRRAAQNGHKAAQDKLALIETEN